MAIGRPRIARTIFREQMSSQWKQLSLIHACCFRLKMHFCKPSCNKWTFNKSDPMAVIWFGTDPWTKSLGSGVDLPGMWPSHTCIPETNIGENRTEFTFNVWSECKMSHWSKKRNQMFRHKWGGISEEMAHQWGVASVGGAVLTVGGGGTSVVDGGTSVRWGGMADVSSWRGGGKLSEACSCVGEVRLNHSYSNIRIFFFKRKEFFKQT